MNKSLKKADKDLTQGNIIRLLIEFSVPLLIGNIFQQLYNTVDSIIVGNYLGAKALAAVGSTTSIVNMFIFFFMGMSAGAGVVISNYYGAKDNEKLHLSVQTTMSFTFILCVVFTILGYCLTPALLRMMKTPVDVFPHARDYLQALFLGLSTLLIYNMGSGILRAVGDSKRPLYVLIFCTVLNTFLDIWFIRDFGLGIKGAAIATVIAQGLSSCVILYLLCNSDGAYRLNLFSLKLDLPILKRICTIGLPSAIQMSITQFSNVFVQSYVNRFGSAVMAGWASYIKIDGFAAQPIMSLSAAVTTFMSQNIGAKEYGRARSTPAVALLIGFPFLIMVCVPLVIYASWFVSLFGSDPEVVRYGTFFMKLITPFYVFMMLDHIFAGALRGADNSLASMIILLFSFVFCRQLYLFSAWTLSGSLLSISFGFPVGWFVCAVLVIYFYYRKSEIIKNAKLYVSN